jgi:hypothetical protein
MSPLQGIALGQHSGTWERSASTLDVEIAVDACVSTPFGDVCQTVRDSAKPRVEGTFTVLGRPCPGQSCDISLETDVAVDNFDLEFKLLGITVGKGKLRDLHLTGQAPPVQVDASGNGVLPASLFQFVGEGRDDESGDSYRVTSNSASRIAAATSVTARRAS